MNKMLTFAVATIAFYGCTTSSTTGTRSKDDEFAVLPKPGKHEKVATFAGGCFWALAEAMLELRGVNKVVSGFAGGTIKNPTYDEVCGRTTNHAETVQIYYDTLQINYATLVKAFFAAHDPTTLNRQGPDEGTDYRSVAFYRTPQEKKIIQYEIAKLNAVKTTGSVVTQVIPFKIFYPAEKYHQGYYRLHLSDNAYLTSVSMPKINKMRRVMKGQLKAGF